MEAAAVELHGAIGQHRPADAVGGKPVKRLVGGAFGHDQFAWRHRKRIDDPKVSYSELLKLLLSPETAHRIKLVTGNTQVSATELNHLTPFDFE